MKLLYLLLAVFLQGVCGQDVFSVQPQMQNVVREGESLTLDCILRDPALLCAWKTVDLAGSLPDGFMINNLSPEWGITAKDPESKTDCSIVINSVTEEHSGKFICSPFLTSGQIDATPAEITVAQKPVAVEFSGEYAGQTQLIASADQPVNVTCEARDARPRATLHWYLANQEIFEGIQVEDETDPGSNLVTSRSTLSRQLGRADDGGELRCEARHAGYSEEDVREVALTVMVQYAPYRPEGSDMGTLYGFTEGEEGMVVVNFTANPEPTVIVWTVGDGVEIGSEGVSEDGRFDAGPLEPQGTGEHQYSVRLNILPVRPEDKDTAFQLRLGNAVGEETLSFQLGTGAPPPPPAPPAAAAEGNDDADDSAAADDDGKDNEGISGGAIGGIIVAVICLLLIIGVIALARSRGKWCFAAKPGEPGAEA